MRNEDIEILDDFQENQIPNSNDIPDMNRPLESQNVDSVNNFDQMISNSSYDNSQSLNNMNYNQNNTNQTVNYNQNTNYSQNMNYNQNYNNQTIDYNQNMNYSQNYNNQINNNQSFQSNYPNDYNNNFSTDVNNNMAQPNQEQDLTITAVYPNGLALEENEELENTRVIKTKKKSGVDLYLVIIVAVLAITLVVLLVVFYF